MASNTRRSIVNVSPIQPDMGSLTNLDRLILAQAVYELGANSWSAVAKLLTKHPLLPRPKSFFTPQVSLSFLWLLHTVY
jgi:bromodomain-containing protein 8